MPKHSKVSICNMALLELGANAITTFDAADTSKEADHCRAFFDICLDEVMEAHTWDFAKQWKALAIDAGYSMIDEKYDIAYSLPGDYVRMSRLVDKDTQYEVRGAHLLTDEEDLLVEYIKVIADTSVFPVYFVRALVVRLKASLNGPLSKKGSKTIDFLNIYENIALPAAKTADARQSNASDEDKQRHVDSSESWLTARE